MAAAQEITECDSWPPADASTIHLIFEYIKDAPKLQADDWKSLDGKAAAILAAASVALTVAGVANPAVGTRGLGLAFLSAAVILYIAVGFHVLRVLRIRGFSDSRAVPDLWPDYRQYGADEIRVRLIELITGSYQDNLTLMIEKGRHIGYAIVGLAIEVVLVAGAFMATRLGI